MCTYLLLMQYVSTKKEFYNRKTYQKRTITYKNSFGPLSTKQAVQMLLYAHYDIFDSRRTLNFLSACLAKLFCWKAKEFSAKMGCERKRRMTSRGDLKKTLARQAALSRIATKERILKNVGKEEKVR